MSATVTKRPNKFNTLKFLDTPTYGSPEETVIEWGEIAGFLYFVMRSELEDNRITIEIAAGEDMAVYALLRLEENCLVIEEIDFHYRLLKTGFARRIIWLIISEAIKAEVQMIDGYISAGHDLKCLVNAFHRYGFSSTSDDGNERFQIHLDKYTSPYA